MQEKVLTQSIQKRPQGSWSWQHVLLTGLALFLVTTLLLFLTGNPNLYPTVILIGNFLVPVVFVVFLYEHQHLSTLTPYSVAICFCAGGVLGLLGAALLEPLFVPKSSSLVSGILIGFIEEGCKIAAVMIVARRLKHSSEMDGLLLGGAVGMGFAALESTGYAFTWFLLSQGHMSASIGVTVLRGLLAPFGHGVWTGILSAILFRASTQNRFHITGLVIVVYLFVSLLHGCWDRLSLPLPFLFVKYPVLGVVGLTILIVLYRQAERRQLQENQENIAG